MKGSSLNRFETFAGPLTTSPLEWRRRSRADLALVALTFAGGFSLWPALIALGPLFTTFETQFGWSRSQVSVAQLIFTATSILAAPLVGAVIDRVGVKRLLMSGLAAAPLTLIVLSAVQGLYWQWLAAWVLLSIVGQMIIPPVWSSGVARHFQARRGLALGASACGFAAAAALVPMVIVSGIGVAEWRTFYIGMAVVDGLILLPLIYVFYPRDAAPVPVRPCVADDRAEPSDFFSDVLRSGPFRLLGIATFLVSLVVGGLLIHLVPILQWRGIGVTTAAALFALYGVGGMAGRLGGGWLLDRFSGPGPTFLMSVAPALAGLLILAAPGGATFPLATACALIGLAGGVEVDVLPYLARRYFPVRYFGRAYLLLSATFVGGAGAAPFLISLSYDATKSYAPFLMASIALGITATVLLNGLARYPAADQEHK
jgi:MFS family permease